MSPFRYKVSKTIFTQGVAILPAAVATARRLSCFQILAVMASITLFTAFMVPSFGSNSFAQVTSESRVLQAILGLTEVVKGQSAALVDTTENIEDDLLFKKKFWQIRFNTTERFGDSDAVKAFLEGFSQNFFGQPVSRFGYGLLFPTCSFDDDSACAFNMESIQLLDNGTSVDVKSIEFVRTGEDIITDIASKDINTPTNLLVDSGIGKFGVPTDNVSAIGVYFDNKELMEGIVEFNGEKPQGLGFDTLCTLAVVEFPDGSRGDICLFGFVGSSVDSQSIKAICLDPEGQPFECLG
jgi:hypothetical protein